MNFPRIKIINLPRSEERRRHMASVLDKQGVTGEFFPAVDGRLMTDEQIAQVYRADLAQKTNWGVLNRGEIGCALSHRALWQELVVSGETGWIILEDDVELLPEFTQVVSALVPKIKNGDVVLFSVGPSELYAFGQEALPAGRRLAWVNQALYLACGYYITPLAAQRLLEKSMPIWFPIDFWYSTPGFKGVTPIKIVSPPLLRQLDDAQCPSDIGGRTDQRIAAAQGKRRGALRQVWRQFRLKMKNKYLVTPEHYSS
ncbi:glycosyl transferase [Oryzomicrobium terrae]|uniref:Glycosyl transferase n=1 Tax=Oryzomicrobium terrae TaxID=1735038 RepID=A0A5C1EBH8_9RHOO|nr:glycosyltransferase family 25 protein [Oryzomicrobium terrae]QEL66351.1 glycosyl transferase [Oryzomicrobium terrae]